MNNFKSFYPSIELAFATHGYLPISTTASSAVFSNSTRSVELFYDRKTVTLFYKCLPFYEAASVSADRLVMLLPQIIESIESFAQTIDWVADVFDQPTVEYGVANNQTTEWLVYDNTTTGKWAVNWVKFYNPHVPTEVKAVLKVCNTVISIVTTNQESTCKVSTKTATHSVNEHLTVNMLQRINSQL